MDRTPCISTVSGPRHLFFCSASSPTNGTLSDGFELTSITHLASPAFWHNTEISLHEQKNIAL